MKFRTDLSTWADWATAIRAIWPTATRLTVECDGEGGIRPVEVQDAEGSHLGIHGDPANPVGGDDLLEAMFWNPPEVEHWATLVKVTVLDDTFTFTTI